MSARIAVAGSLNMDHLIRVPRLPSAGETVAARSFQTVAGGKGANQAVAAARLGGQVVLIGRVGDDVFGSALLRGLAESGVDTRFVQRDATAPTGLAFVLVAEDGENSIAIVPGANAALTPAHVLAAEEAIRDVSVLVTQLEVPVETVTRALELARRHRVTTLLNPAPAQPLPESLLGLVDFLILNETEAALLAGSAVDNLAGAERAAGKLRERAGMTVILTLGDKGALLVGEETLHVAAHSVPVIDTTAAGDAFVGVFAAALAEGRSPREAARRANAAGALAVTRLGAQPSLPSHDELEAFLKRAEPREPGGNDEKDP